MALPDSEVENFFGTFFLLFAIVLALVVIFEVAKRIWPGFGLLISAHQDAVTIGFIVMVFAVLFWRSRD